MTRKFLFAALAALICTLHALGAAKIRVACVGDSVTFGMTIENREQNCYPVRLQALLGDDYDVRNFGHSGTTLLKHGHTPYTSVDEYRAALDFAPDIVVIHLGLNDTDPRDWPEYGDEFVADYLALIDDFRRANPDSRICICRMTPIFHPHRRFKEGTREWYREEQRVIEQTALMAGVQLIDLQGPLYSRPDLMPDALHPNAEGAAVLASTVFSAITGDFGGLQMPSVYSDNMVLQCERPLVIAGTADAGEKVTVKIAGQKVSATAADNGRWEATLKPLRPSFKPLTLEIATPSRRLKYENVLAGEVWLCSGQSNMEFRVNESAASERTAQTERAEAGIKGLRLFNMQPICTTDNIVWDDATLEAVNNLAYFRPAAWSEATAETAARFSAVGFAFGAMLADSLQRPVGLILNAVGGSTTESWVPRRTLEAEYVDVMYNLRNNTIIQEWVRGRRAKNVSGSQNPQQRHSYDPCYLFEAGIQPLDRFPVNGVIWYQGESNAHNIEAHEKLFTLLVTSWREWWNDDTMPFLFVQLSSINRPSWPRFRDSQRRLADDIDNCHMAVSSDLGHPSNVHPVRKKLVGERLARLALHYDYGFENVVPSGPAPLSAKAEKGGVVVSFDFAEGLRSADGEPLRTFEVAEFDGAYHPAEAVVEEGKVRLSCPEVATPRFVRYGWQPYTTANLANGDELPASTFKIEVK